MSDTIISVENLGKAYRIGLKEEIPDTIVGALQSWIKAPLTNFTKLRRLNTFSDNGHGDDIIWALKDVSFEVKQGDVVGIIGRNGAGKSTLLKILSRITEPTTGRAVIHGRVSSLLEVGTGFHPELTGRENVYMNGTILGMRKKEIDRKFDEIVDFSGVEKFLDTPIKRYSSGMNVRLAFAVAAHLDPEILIIDEVLAVGDAEFQKKCLGKMQDVARGGRTVLFVSHNMAAVTNLCTRAMLVKQGAIECDAPVDTVVAMYSATRNGPNSSFDLSSVGIRNSNKVPLIQKVVFRDRHLNECCHIPCGEELNIDFLLSFGNIVKSPVVSIGFINSLNQKICSAATYLSDSQLTARTTGMLIRCRIPILPLAPGTYTLSIAAGDNGNTMMDQVEDYVVLIVSDADFYNNGRIPIRSLGDSLIRSEWSQVTNSYTTP